MSFVEELKRRNVVRVGLAYAVIGWVLAQIAEFAFENFGAPEWVLKSFVVLLLLGLPIVLFLAWAFEVTPEGIKLEKDVDRSQSITPKTGRKLDRMIIGVLAIALAYLAYDKFSGEESNVVSDEEQSIAVLPFANMSDDSDHFADGLTEELLNLLAQNRDLKVAGRTSSFAFKGKNEDLRAIGETLGVSKVLEGSVRRSGDQVRITAQLINVEDGFHIWSATYDNAMADIFAVQDKVAGAITDALQLHLTPVAKRFTNNPDAYALYLEAVALSGLGDEADVPNAIEILNRATTLDPQFAKAFELKALFHWISAGWFVSADIGRERVYEAATTALAIDPTLAAAASLARTSHPTDWSWIQELDALETLLESDRSVRVLDTYGYDLGVSGYFAEAEKMHKEVLARDPLSANAWWRLAEVLMGQGRIDEAKQAAQKANGLNPMGGWDAGLQTLVMQALSSGDDPEAIRLMNTMFDPEYFLSPSAEAFVAAMRDPENGRASLREWVEYRIANDPMVIDAILARSYYLTFGYLDLYTEALDSYGQPGIGWSDAEVLESYGIFFSAAGYRATQHFLDRAKATGLFALWDHRGAPDFCSKETGDWVCR